MDILNRVTRNEKVLPDLDAEPIIETVKVTPQLFKLSLPKIQQDLSVLQHTPMVPEVNVEPVEIPVKVITSQFPKMHYDLSLQAKQEPPAQIPERKPFALQLPKFHRDMAIQEKQEPAAQKPERKSFTLQLPKLQYDMLLPPDPKELRRPEPQKTLTLNIPTFEHELGVKPDPVIVPKKREEYDMGIRGRPKFPEERPFPMSRLAIPIFAKMEPRTEHIQKNDGIVLIPNVIPTITFEDKPIANIARLSYNRPQCSDLAVLLVFFDYIGSARILINYLFMVEKLKLANIPVFTLELVIHGKKPKIHDAIHVYGSSYLFQKEHLLRLLEKSIPAQFTKLACLDADVIFENPTWYDDLSIMLDTNHVVQCFDVSYWLDLSYTNAQKIAASCLAADRLKRFWDGQSQPVHPGFGWAFRRKHYRESGYFDKAIIGSGDTLFAYGLLDYPIKLEDKETFIYRQSYEKWISEKKQINFSYLKGRLYHLYHGPIPNRQYVSRYHAFRGVSNIEDAVAINNYGVYELIYSKFNIAMLEFFKTRNDDGLD